VGIFAWVSFTSNNFGKFPQLEGQGDHGVHTKKMTNAPTVNGQLCQQKINYMLFNHSAGLK